MTTRAADLRQPAATALPNAHAHADSRHRRPLWDALAAGFTSIEVDVWAVRGKVLVGHTIPRPWRTLQRLYLDPITMLVHEKGCVYEDFDQPIVLMLDVKSDAQRSRPVIEEALAPYEGVVSHWRDAEFVPGPVTVVVSGNLSSIPYDAPRRWTGADGRVRATGGDIPAEVMPLRSDCWPELFSWRGRGPMPTGEGDLLENFVADAHSRGQRVRFWDTPDRRGRARDTVWSTLLDAGVDLIDTDDLRGLRAFLLGRARQSAAE